MNKRLIILTLGLSLCAGVFAQGLHKEITVEQEIVPKKRDASRITVLPTVSLPTIQPVKLNFSDRVVTTRVPNAITTLEPIAFGDKLYTSPYKGYVALGIFPLFNADFSAGYRLVDSDKTRLSAWGQYNGDVYKKNIPLGTLDGGPQNEMSKHIYWRDHTASLGLDLHQAIGAQSFLDAQVNYTYGYHNTLYSSYNGSTVPQISNGINAEMKFNSRHQGLLYAVGIDYQHFGFNEIEKFKYEDGGYGYTPVKQNLIGATFNGLLDMGEPSYIGLDADINILKTSNSKLAKFPYEGDFITDGNATTGLISLKPHYLYTTYNVTARIGAQVDLSIKDGKALHIAPDVTLAWTPTQTIGLELRAHGGSTLNTLSSLYNITPYINGSLAYTQSHTPYALDAKVALGPFMGASVEFFGGYAKANNWLMPVWSGDYVSDLAIFETVDLSGWHLGAAVSYEYRDIASARVSYETAPNDYDNAYYEWRDRAKHVVNAELKVRPIKPLLLSLNWEFRAGRHAYYYETNPNSELNMYERYKDTLGAMSTLNIGAGYEFTDRITFFARGENLLNRRYMHIGERPSQGITGLIGASFKF